MNQYVLILSIGPVQGFIAAARKSRDLWSGSWLLSEMAKAGAKYLHDQGATLIFPIVTNAEELKPENKKLSVGNKLQVVISAQSAQEVQHLIEETKSAIQSRFDQEAIDVEVELGNFKIRKNIWQSQLKDYLEVQGAYALIDTSNKEGYKIACDQASIMLAARKATRDFRALATSAYDPAFMIPKSSLDGARETVLPDVFRRNHHIVKRLGLSDSEQLDSSGIIKRLGGDVDQFTPYVRVAADSWVQNISEDEARKISEAYEALIAPQLATRVTGNHSCYAKLPYDGEYLYSFRLEAMLNRYQSLKRKIMNKSSEEEDLDPAEVEQAYQKLSDLKRVLQPIWRKYGDPCNYGVLLLADGDKMGELLDHAGDQMAHQEITTALSQFAGSVEAIMRDHHGHRIYAGGDDVLGFVPLASAYDCAKTLSEKFAASLDTVAKKLKATTPTLSVGLAIAHINTPLGHIRHLAKEAEKMAKGDQVKDPHKQRNALGIVLAVRSGSTTGLRLRWDDKAGLQAFQTWIADYQQKQITSRLAYDTREIYLQTELLARDIENDLLVKIRAAEFKRMLKKARTTSGARLDDSLIEKLEKRLAQLENLDHLATELIIARWMAAKTQRDLGRE